MKPHRILTVILCVAALALIAAPAAHAQKSPFAADTEIYYEVHLSGPDMQNVLTDVYDRLSQIELLEERLAGLWEKVEIDPGTDILPWMGNRVRFGIVGPGSESAIRRHFDHHMSYQKRLESADAFGETMKQLRLVKNAVELYKEKKGRIPRSMFDIEPSFIKLEKLPKGGYLNYRRISDDVYEIYPPANQFKDLGFTGEVPRYNSKDGLVGHYKNVERTVSVKNLLLVLDVVDAKAAAAFLDKMEAIMAKDVPGRGITFSRKQVKNVTIAESGKFSYALAGKVLLFADSPQVIERALSVMEKPESSIYSSPVFKDFQKTSLMGDGMGEILFVNLVKARLTPQLLKVKNPTLASLLTNLYYLGYSSSMGGGDATGCLEIALLPGQKNPLFKNHFARKPFGSEKIMENLPAGLPMAVVYNVGEIWEVLKTIGTEEKQFNEGLTAMTSQLSIMTGLELEKDILMPTTGELGVSYKMRDLILSGILGYARSRSRASGDDKEPGTMEFRRGRGKLSGMLRMEKLPITFFIQVADMGAYKKTFEMLREMGGFEATDYKGISIYRNKKVAYCFVGNLLMLHSFPSDRAIKKHIDTLLTRNEKMGSVTRYQDFKKNIKGRPLVVQYQDSRWAASISKGLILFLLPEFEDYAQKMGDYKENWSALSVHPQGLQVFIKAYKSK